MTDLWRIENKTGKVHDTKVITPEGAEAHGIAKIEIEPMLPQGRVKATITVYATVDLVAEVEQKLA